MNPEICEHNEYDDHGCCLDCGFERDLGELVDEAQYRLEDR